MAFTIDIPNRRIITDATVNTVQEINDACRDFEDLPSVMAVDKHATEQSDGIIKTSGKDDLGLGIFAPIILRFINNWRLYYEAQAGPGWTTVSVVGGTLIATNDYGDNPIENSAFVNWSKVVAQDGALLAQPSLESASYNGQVVIDVVGGEAGTEYPIGTRLNPVDNMTDAHTIAAENGLYEFFIISSMTLGSGDYSDGHTFTAQTPSAAVLTIDTLAEVSNCEFRELTMQGVLDNSNVLRDCALLDITHVNGFIHDCALFGTITLGGSAQATIMASYSGVAGGGPAQYPYIDMGGSGNTLALRGYSGGLGVKNSAGVATSSLDFDSGRIVFDADCTGGDFTVRGICDVTDNSAGATINDLTINYRLDASTLAEELTAEQTAAEHTTDPVNGIVILRNTVVSRRWEADAWEDADQTIRYKGQGLESVGQLSEVAWS